MVYRELDKLLKKNGFERSKRKGTSHVKYTKGGRSFPVPIHSGDIPKGTLDAILKQAGLK